MFNETTLSSYTSLFEKFRCVELVDQKTLEPYDISWHKVGWREVTEKNWCKGYYLPLYFNGKLSWKCYGCGKEISVDQKEK